MRLVVALGGNALLRRGAPLTAANQSASIGVACAALAPVVPGNELVITHGNGPQVGLLALQAASYDETSGYPFDVLDAQTEGSIGYLLERELRNRLAPGAPVATLMTMIRVDGQDPAFAHPSKFVGPVYSTDEATRLTDDHGWTMAEDGSDWRRVVPSPLPQQVVELDLITLLLDSGSVVVCAGGGGVPVTRDPGTGRLAGAEAVVDKDRSSALLALDLGAERLVIVTDVDAVYEDWGTERQRAIARAHPDDLLDADDLDGSDYPAGSMGPKVAAACAFARSGKGDALIGSLDQLPALLAGHAGTTVSTSRLGKAYR